MSYEGEEQYLCENGHLRIFDAYDSPSTAASCSCGARFVWYTSVDQTNGMICQTHGYDCERGGTDESCNLSFSGNVLLEIAADAITEKCNLGHIHVTKEQIYKIPSKGVGHHLT